MNDTSPNDDAQDTVDVDLEENETCGKDDGETTLIGVGGYSVTVDASLLPYFGQIVAAVVLLIAVTVPNVGVKNRGYGIAVPVVAILFALLGCVLVTQKSLYETPLGTVPLFGQMNAGGAVARFLLLWWFIAAAILTFNGPFLVTSNGYFAAWGGVIFAAMAAGVTSESVQSTTLDNGYAHGLMLASIVQICALPSNINGPSHGESVYALVIAIVSVFSILLLKAHEKLNSIKLPVFLLLTILWLVSACLTTFRGPFLVTGNGYFSAWFGFALCGMTAANLNN